MPTEIVDGKGSGRRAEVDEQNRLVVTAINETQEHRTSQDLSEAFHIATAESIDTLTLAAAFDGVVQLLQNSNPDKKLIIERVVLSADAVGLILRLRRNPILGSLANNTPILGTNLNFGSQKTANIISHNWDEVAGGITGVSGGNLIKTFILNAGITTLRTDGVFILEQNDVFGIEVNNPTAGAIEFEVGIRFYFE